MKRLTTLLLTAAIALSSTAQTALEEIRANKYLAGSNYLDYNRQLPTKKLTPAPKGYVPYYMSHYGRHGSRWLINDDSYTSVTEPLSTARKAGKLTPRGEEVLQLLELDTLARRPIGELSGGQRQRVLMARALATQPRLLVLDEPSTYIDRNSENHMYSLLQSLNKQCAIVLVSHDMGAVIQTVRNIAHNMAFLIRSIAAQKEEKGLPVEEHGSFTSFPDGK